MEAGLINRSILCVLKQDQVTSVLVVEEVRLINDLIDEVASIFEMLNDQKYLPKDVVEHMLRHQKLKVLLQAFDYCVALDIPYQKGLLGLEDKLFQLKYMGDFSQIKDVKSRNTAIQSRKNQFKEELSLRLLACSLKKTYEICERNKEIIAYSHRRIGWTMPAFKCNSDFSFEIKTNFGYGSSSYFYTKITYQNIDLVPFSDWILYKISNVYEIVRYSSSHLLEDESWANAMSYIASAYNLLITNKADFIEKYLFEQCENLINGLVEIFENHTIEVKYYSFLNLERDYVDLKSDEHNIIEYKGEKISGALYLATFIRKYHTLFSVDSFISKIEDLNLKILPILQIEQLIIKSKISELLDASDSLIAEKNKLKVESEINYSMIKWMTILLENSDLSSEDSSLMKNFFHSHPMIKKVEDAINVIEGEINIHDKKIERLAITLFNLEKYEDQITNYFNSN